MLTTLLSVAIPLAIFGVVNAAKYVKRRFNHIDAKLADISDSLHSRLDTLTSKERVSSHTKRS